MLGVCYKRAKREGVSTITIVAALAGPKRLASHPVRASLSVFDRVDRDGQKDRHFGKNIQQRGVVWNEAIRASHRWASTFPMPPASSITYPIDFTDREKSLLNSYAAVFLNKNKHFSSADATRAELDTACDLILKDWPMKKGKTPRIARVVFTEAKNNLLRAEKANLQENEESAMGTASKRARRKRPLVESEDED